MSNEDDSPAYDPWADFEDESEPYTPLSERQKIEQRQQRVSVLENIELQAQLLNEFTCLDSWALFSEAIPLAMGIHPKHSDSIGLIDFEMFNDISRLARATIGANSLVLNPSDKEELWRVKPKEFAQWLISKKINMIEPLRAITSDKPSKQKKADPSIKEPSARLERFAAVREKIFIAALAVLANYRDQCIGKSGHVSANAIYDVMNDKALIWFEDGELPLDDRTIIDHISKAIKTAK
ncbi:hypothetical protein [Reinekea marinisedimentorum]|uniref:Uncharacterized protein n=1 Tax=Reinekea marinisedimentorum TaxID=230495 RepID=A0A4R3I2F9_9GAMM|nr:hypothetical protein [Reinekea marinisedimentorum]TCS38079.1 hypothetical protein BCF53_1174 [Reinekea marinisedimentorum]